MASSQASCRTRNVWWEINTAFLSKFTHSKNDLIYRNIVTLKPEYSGLVSWSLMSYCLKVAWALVCLDDTCTCLRLRALWFGNEPRENAWGLGWPENTKLARTSLQSLYQNFPYAFRCDFLASEAITNCCPFSGFSLDQDDEDKDEREAHEENFQIPSLKEKESAENNGARGRRASHFYGHVTKQGEDTSEGNKKNGGTKIRPPKPRWTNSCEDCDLQTRRSCR